MYRRAAVAAVVATAAAAGCGVCADALVEHVALGRRGHSVYEWGDVIRRRADGQPQPFRDELLCEVCRRLKDTLPLTTTRKGARSAVHCRFLCRHGRQRVGFAIFGSDVRRFAQR